jgi:LysM repeat protein
VRNRTGLILLLLILSGHYSCRVARPLATAPSGDVSASSYISKYKDLAISEMKRTGVPASITLAQGMLESDYGRSSLARLGNNHFGIKCHGDWNGQTIRQHDDRRNECFRKYSSSEASFYDHSDFLKSGSRYRFLFDLDPMDYKAWAHGLKKAGYATNPEYATLLIRKIEENNLDDLDRLNTSSISKANENITVKDKVEVREEAGSDNLPVSAGSGSNDRSMIQGETITFGEVLARTPRIMENNRVQYIIVKDGETREQIEKEFQLLRWELPRYNDLKDNFVTVPGQILYLEPKREKAESGFESHTVMQGETMHTISQKYGIRLKSLLGMNKIDEGEEPSPGQKVLLK